MGVRYASLNVHQGFVPSRRDDLESIGYLLIHFLRGDLPWQGMKAKNTKAKHAKIGACKQATMLEVLCLGYPPEFVSFVKYCRSLEYAQEPNYEHLRKLMTAPFKREGFSDDSRLDWMDATDLKRRRVSKKKSLSLTRREDAVTCGEI